MILSLPFDEKLSIKIKQNATVNELTVLSNLETHNAHMIREGKDKKERFNTLKEIAEYQLGILNTAEYIKTDKNIC